VLVVDVGDVVRRPPLSTRSTGSARPRLAVVGVAIDDPRPCLPRQLPLVPDQIDASAAVAKRAGKSRACRPGSFDRRGVLRVHEAGTGGGGLA
jgi:hypothetical protein